jgi:hypothetical protein
MNAPKDVRNPGLLIRMTLEAVSRTGRGLMPAVLIIAGLFIEWCKIHVRASECSSEVRIVHRSLCASLRVIWNFETLKSH